MSDPSLSCQDRGGNVGKWTGIPAWTARSAKWDGTVVVPVLDQMGWETGISRDPAGIDNLVV